MNKPFWQCRSCLASLVVPTIKKIVVAGQTRYHKWCPHCLSTNVTRTRRKKHGERALAAAERVRRIHRGSKLP